MATVIEFMHRITSGVALAGVAGLVWWARRLFPAGHRVRKAAWASLGFILLEALLGAGLVLLRYVDKNESWGRAVYLSAHMTNTLLLLAVIAATAYWSRASAASFEWRTLPVLQRGAFFIVLLAATTGVAAALGDTIWPAVSLSEGVAADFSHGAPMLLRLRLVHPVIAALAGLYMLLTAFLVLRGAGRKCVVGITVLQVAAGCVNILLLAPVWMQILHLALACGLWLALVMSALTTEAEAPETLAAHSVQTSLQAPRV